MGELPAARRKSTAGPASRVASINDLLKPLNMLL